MNDSLMVTTVAAFGHFLHLLFPARVPRKEKNVFGRGLPPRARTSRSPAHAVFPFSSDLDVPDGEGAHRQKEARTKGELGTSVYPPAPAIRRGHGTLAFGPGVGV